MMNAKVHELLNQQINKEFYSAYLYLDFSNYFEAAAWTGLQIGIRSRRRRSAITQCCSISICRMRVRR